MIPKIIHQIWEGRQSLLPENLRKLGDSWTRNNPDWEYRIWDYDAIDRFIRQEYPHIWVKNYYRLSYNIQRWDVIRYLIMWKMGGVYADFDTECYRSLNPLLEHLEAEGKRCFFQKDNPKENDDLIAPSIMGSEPGVELFHNISERILEKGFYRYNYVSDYWRGWDTLNSTGPHAIGKIFNAYDRKEEVSVIHENKMMICPQPYNVADIPFDKRNEEFRSMMCDGMFAGHYFFHQWIERKINKLTVIIPFLNEGEEVRRTVESIRATAKTDVMIILINDASEDGYNYRVVAEHYGCRYIEHKERMGVAESRNEGVRLSETKYCMLLDAHCEFYPDKNGWDNKLMLVLSENPRSVVCCQTRSLWKTRENVRTDRTVTYGARLSLEKKDVIRCVWNRHDPDPDSNLVEIPVVLGGAYGVCKDYYLHIHGLNGLIRYGLDEELLSIKVWASGGRCLLIKNLIVGHIYRDKFPYVCGQDICCGDVF